MSLEVNFESLKVHVCCLSPAITNSKPLELSDQINNFFPKLSWSGCFTQETEKQ